jgi:hypothetical protein
MTHMSSAGTSGSAPPPPARASLPSRPSQIAARLDRTALIAGIAQRRMQLAELEAALAAACEAEAARHRSPGVRVENRATWDRPMWNRYLAAAAGLEPEYGPRMRRLCAEIERLQRLSDLPAAG